MTLVEKWCPSCSEWTSLIERGTCQWCDTQLEDRQRRGGWTRPDLRGGKYTEAQLSALHIVHVRDGVSLNELAKRTYEKVGYKSHGSAASAVSIGWKRLGLRARDRVEQVKRTCTVHGNAPKRRTAEQERAYRRFLQEQRGWRSQQGPGQPQCKGVKRGPPRKGARCQRPAQEGSDYCLGHDPRRALEVQAATAKMRRRQPRPDTLPMAPFAAWVAALGVREGSVRAAAVRYGWPLTAAYRYAKGYGTNGEPKDTIARRTVEQWAQRAGEDLADVYPAERQVAA